VNDSHSVGLRQTPADLAGQRPHLLRGQRTDSLDRCFQALTRNVLHGDERLVPIIAEIVHPADIFMRDPAGQPELVAEPAYHVLVRSDLGVEKLEGDVFLNLRIHHLVDRPHASPTQLFNHPISTGEHLAGRKTGGDRPQGSGPGPGSALGIAERSSAVTAEAGPFDIVGSAFGTNHVRSPALLHTKDRESSKNSQIREFRLNNCAYSEGRR